MQPKVNIDCWAMQRRTSESCIHNSKVPRKGNCKRDHSLRSSFTYLKEREFERAQHDDLSNYSASASLITVRGRCSEIIDPAAQSVVWCSKANKHILNDKIENKFNFVCNSTANEQGVPVDWPSPNLQCAGCSHIIREVEPANLFNSTTTMPEMVPPKQLSSIKQFQTMSNEQSVALASLPDYNQPEPSAHSAMTRNGRNETMYTSGFLAIMNSLASTVIRVVYHIFLIIAQVMPVFEVFPYIYDFVTTSMSEIRDSVDRKEAITKAALLVLQVLVILVSFVFVLCAILFPVFTLCSSVLRRMFFFI